MKPVKFKELWDYYPDESPCDKKVFSNQCAIKVGSALAKCGVKTTTLVTKKRHCWFHKNIDGHVLSAEELAAGLKKTKIKGIHPPVVLDASGYKTKIAGKKGIIFFKDYWLRTVDRPDRPTGDHIDLWNGSRITDVSSWFRVQFGIVYEGVWSDFEKSNTVIFWRVDD